MKSFLELGVVIEVVKDQILVLANVEEWFRQPKTRRYDLVSWVNF